MSTAADQICLRMKKSALIGTSRIFSSRHSLPILLRASLSICTNTSKGAGVGVLNKRIVNDSYTSRLFGGYIEDAQLALYGLEIYRDLNGEKARIPADFIVPVDVEEWPQHLWGFELGKSISKHLEKPIFHNVKDGTN